MDESLLKIENVQEENQRTGMRESYKKSVNLGKMGNRLTNSRKLDLSRSI
jgi:hypothetical protein